jgi:hypothetical protein
VHPIVAWKGSSGYVVSTDPDRLNLGFIHDFLATACWSRGVPRDTVERAIANSLPFGLYAPSGEQAGFARALVLSRCDSEFLWSFGGISLVIDGHAPRSRLRTLRSAQCWRDHRSPRDCRSLSSPVRRFAFEISERRRPPLAC